MRTAKKNRQTRISEEPDRPAVSERRPKMKEVIRRGLFETNSSSTHAVTIRRKAPDEAWRTEEEIAGKKADDYTFCGRKEIRSAYEKMLLVWGIECEDHYLVVPYQALDDDDDESTEQEKQVRAYAIEVHERFKNHLLDECAKVADFDREETLRLMDDCTRHGYNHPLCCRYFNEDVLDDCTCGLSVRRIADFLGLDGDDPDERYGREFAKRLFSDDVYFVTREGFYGGCWHIGEVIF